MSKAKPYVTREDAIQWGYRTGKIRRCIEPGAEVRHGVKMGWLTFPDPALAMTDRQIDAFESAKSKARRVAV